MVTKEEVVWINNVKINMEEKFTEYEGKCLQLERDLLKAKKLRELYSNSVAQITKVQNELEKGDENGTGKTDPHAGTKA